MWFSRLPRSLSPQNANSEGVAAPVWAATGPVVSATTATGHPNTYHQADSAYPVLEKPPPAEASTFRTKCRSPPEV